MSITTAAQIRAARSLLDLEQGDLAKAAGVSARTLIRLERGAAVRPANVEAIRAALEKKGVIFIEENGDGPGVRLRKRKR